MKVVLAAVAVLTMVANAAIGCEKLPGAESLVEVCRNADGDVSFQQPGGFGLIPWTIGNAREAELRFHDFFNSERGGLIIRIKLDPIPHATVVQEVDPAKLFSPEMLGPDWQLYVATN